MTGMIPSEDAARRIQAAVLWVERQYRNPGKRAERVVRNRGGACVDRNEKWVFTIGGTPTGGTFDVSLNVLGTTETMQFAFDDSSSDVQTELETHSEIASGDVTVSGGPFPDSDITIEFTGDLAAHEMDKPPINFAALTGGSGVIVVLARWTPGRPSDGSVAP